MQNIPNSAATSAHHLMNQIRDLEQRLLASQTEVITAQAEARAAQAEAATAKNMIILIQQQYQPILAAANAEILNLQNTILEMQQQYQQLMDVFQALNNE